MIPEDQKNMTTQWCSTGRLFTAATQALSLSLSLRLLFVNMGLGLMWYCHFIYKYNIFLWWLSMLRCPRTGDSVNSNNPRTFYLNIIINNARYQPGLYILVAWEFCWWFVQHHAYGLTTDLLFFIVIYTWPCVMSSSHVTRSKKSNWLSESKQHYITIPNPTY